MLGAMTTPRFRSLAPATVGCALVACSATVAAAPALSAVRSVRVGDTVTLKASGFEPGRYALVLVADDRPTRRSACVARVAGRKQTTGGRVTLRGEIPRRLTCWENNSVKLGRVKTSPGKYHLVVGVPDGPAGFDGDHSFLRRAITIRR